MPVARENGAAKIFHNETHCDPIASAVGTTARNGASQRAEAQRFSRDLCELGCYRVLA